MKFVCDRCQTKYSIADEKVRGKILKVRCKSCSNVITVREASAAIPAHLEPSEFEDSARTVVASVPDHLAAMNAAAAPRRSSAAMPTVGSTGAPPAPPDDVQWFLALEGVQKGPFSRKGIVDKLFALPRDADVHVWNEKLGAWKPPKDVPVIERELQARRRPGAAPPPPPGMRPRSASGPQPAQAAAAARTTKSHPLPGPHGTTAGAHAAGHAPAASGEHGPHRGPHPSNGVAAHASTAGGAPVVPLTGESDALNALNLKQSDVAGSGVPWHAAAVPSIATTSAISSPSQLLKLPRQRNTKLIFAFLGIVGVIVVVVTFNLMKKPAAVTVDKPKTTSTEEGIAVLSDKINQENGQKNGPDQPPVVAQPEQSSSIKIEPTRATVATVKPTKPGRRPPRGARVTQRRGGAAAAAGQGAGAEGDPSLSRFSDTSGRPLNLQPGGGGGARGTPAQSDITRVISNNKAGIKICYQRALLRDSSLTHGKINVRVSIGLSGRAKSVNVDGPPAFRALEPCIREVLSRWAFPPSSEEYGTEFSYVFQGNE